MNSSSDHIQSSQFASESQVIAHESSVVVLERNGNGRDTNESAAENGRDTNGNAAEMAGTPTKTQRTWPGH